MTDKETKTDDRDELELEPEPVKDLDPAEQDTEAVRGGKCVGTANTCQYSYAY